MTARRLLAGAALALALALVAAGAVVGQRRAREAETSPLPSTENPGPRGLAAARVFLVATGRRVVRLEAPGDAPPPGAVVVLAAPGAALAPADAAALLAHARAGGTLVWAAGRVPQPALERLLAARAEAGVGERTAIALAPHRLVADLALPVGGGTVRSSREGAIAVAGGDSFVAALSLPVGQGEVILLSGPEALSNARIGEAGALDLLVRLGARDPVAFDERWLSLRDVPPTASGRVLALLAAQALVAGAALVLGRARRLGAVRPPPAPGSARTSRDYLASLAVLYRRAGAERELARSAWERLRRSVERRTGIPARLPPEAARARLALRSPGAAEAHARGEAALAGPRPLLGVTQAAADLERALAPRSPRRNVL